jgi:hypothetical protein
MQKSLSNLRFPFICGFVKSGILFHVPVNFSLCTQEEMESSAKDIKLYGEGGYNNDLNKFSFFKIIVVQNFF